VSYSGDGGPATSAGLITPNGVAVDSSGNLYISDYLAQRIRRVDAASGDITMVAGGGSDGDGGPATSAFFYYPNGLAEDRSGDFFISDELSGRIRRVDGATGIITTVAGNGSVWYSGDGGPATSAGLNYPAGVAVDMADNLFIADTQGNRIRRVDAATGTITTVAGGAWPASGIGDGGPATSARLFGRLAWRWTSGATSSSPTNTTTVSGAWTLAQAPSPRWPVLARRVLAATAKLPPAPS